MWGSVYSPRFMVWLWSDSLCSTIVMDHTGDTGITTWILCWWVAHRAIAALFSLRWRFMSSYIYLPIWLQSVCHITHFSAHSTSDPYRWWCAWCNLGVLLEKTFFVSNGTMMFSVPSAFVSQILGLRVTNIADVDIEHVNISTLYDDFVYILQAYVQLSGSFDLAPYLSIS